MMTVEELRKIICEACSAAKTETIKFKNHYHIGSCGFAWVRISHYNGVRIKGNTKMGKLLSSCGIAREFDTKQYHIWNPSGEGTQNVDALYAGAKAAALVLEQYGFTAVPCSRLD